MKTFHKARWAALLSAGAILMGCGGGGGTGTPVTNSGIDWPATPSWPVSPRPDTPVDDKNTVPIVVDRSMGSINMPAVTITVCTPGAQGSGRCVSVDRMLLDTGSVGVRVSANALKGLTSPLLIQSGATDDPSASGQIPGSAQIAECAQFASGFTWGPIKRADVTIGSKTASNIPVQVINADGYTIPPDCAAQGGPDLGSVITAGANGIIGIGHFVRDWPAAAQMLLPGAYYFCPTTTSCTGTRVALDKQVMNPVAAFTTNNNGTIISLPSLPPGGQARVTGQLIFGVGTQQNNALPSKANVLPLDAYGFFTTQYNGQVFANSAIDSGTNGYAFMDAAIPSMGDWYTPPGTLTFSATLEAISGAGAPVKVPFSIGNAYMVTASGYAAYDNIGGPMTTMFLWGLPFFYGRNVYTVLENTKVGTQAGPFVAF